MYYFSKKIVKDSFNGIKSKVDNKFLGILSILKAIKSSPINENLTYCIKDGEASKWLDEVCYLEEYEGKYGNSNLYIKFSHKWKEYVENNFIKDTVCIYHLIIFVYKYEAFTEEPSYIDLLSKFCEEFHLSQDIISKWFDLEQINLDFSESPINRYEIKSLLNLSSNTISLEANYSISARAGELSRAPFVQTLYAGMDSIKCLLILKDNIDLYYNDKKPNRMISSSSNSHYRPYITAIKSKPFLLLAGISGTGKSRIVRELARACWEEDSEEYKAQKPKNFEMVQVKPNWHDSSELIGYVSRVSGKAEYIPGDFLKFVARAWEDLETPYFLCLDEMNLAPVEQYFAEYLSVIESRKSKEDGTVVTDPILRTVVTDPILRKEKDEWYFNLTAAITTQENIRTQFNDEGITLPQNLIVVGTVNMDETTFSFSRKVLDRAMTIEMNEVDLYGGLTDHYEPIGKLGKEELIGTAVEGVDVYGDNQDVCNIALDYLKAVNDVLEGTPFKVAYRTRNEFLLYVVNNLPYNKDEDGNELQPGYVIARALDEITSMKILSRIEGDDTKVNDVMLDTLSKTIADKLTEIAETETFESSVSLAKIAEMKRRLASGYTSFWS